jgi:hypothetical protein
MGRSPWDMGSGTARDSSSYTAGAVAWVRLRNGRMRKAELHWYEAHGIGRKEIKRKRYVG